MVPVWSVVLVLAIALPWLHGGYVLSYDMVWVPHLDLDRAELWGLGTGLPRAVPSDAVIALLGAVLPMALVQRVVVMGALLLLALGGARLLRERGTAPQLAAATFAVWNPYVAERLVLGQWPVVVAAAGLMWLAATLAGPDGLRWPVVVLALAATAMTPATGVMGLVLAVALGVRSGLVGIVLVAALVNGPWVVSGLLHASIARTDPASVRLFELQGEGFLGRLGSALTLGGIWNTEVVPTSRTLPLTMVIALVIGTVMVIGLVGLARRRSAAAAGLAVAGAVGLAVALAGWLVPDLVARVVEDVPGGGLVRDGTRWLALLLPLEVAALGHGVAALIGRAKDTSWAVPTMVLGVLVPLAAIPDLAWGVAGRLEPVSYPSSWADARRVVDKTSVRGDVVSLPFSAYRRPSWNRDRPVLDPAGRYFGRTTVTNDELEVSGRVIAGEDPRAAAVGRVLASGDDVAEGLARSGVGIVVLQTDAPGADAAGRAVRGLREIPVAGEGLRVFTVPGAEVRAVDPDDRRTMTITWALAGATVLLALLATLRGAARSVAGATRGRTRSRSGPS
ncbi:hypothetical protein [Aeromicrobium sp. Root472D3]|uniref:hypothetical protein n=1 Tax=Aeromicrobium sp. Root472D3 TaxID=1736540 RepID=UPI0006F69637|nr:hypothetical protein [Aeromicrobium sp. Root472D3]KQX76072.1 hypothetical protein ASD10_13340 [Aeromicrobium sp. Root472D3]